jgi:hypothetical protein
MTKESGWLYKVEKKKKKAVAYTKLLERIGIHHSESGFKMEFMSK